MNIRCGKEFVDIERKGRAARFSGDLGQRGFRAHANSMEWICPKSDRQIRVSETERREWVEAISSHFANAKNRVYFIDDLILVFPAPGEGALEKKRAGLRKSWKRASLSYTYRKVKASDIVELLSLFNAENIFIKNVNVETDNAFYKSMKEKGTEHARSPNSLVETHTNITILDCIRDKISGVFEETLRSKPEMLIIYVADLSLKQFLYCTRESSDSEAVMKRVSDCVFEIKFDKNTFSLTFNAESFCLSDLEQKIDNAFKGFRGFDKLI